MNELQEARSLTVVAAEINALTANMLSGVIEIGRRMCEAKEMVPYGTFGDWIKENTGYSSSTANNFMRLYKEYGDRQGCLFGVEAECQTIGKLSYTKALALLSVPENERENFACEVDAEHISTRELEQAIRERDEARKALDKERASGEGAAMKIADLQSALEKANEEAGRAIDRADDAEQTVKKFSEENVRLTDDLANAERRIRELENRPVDVAVQQPSQEDIDKAVAEAMAESEKAHAEEIEELKSNKDAEVKRADKLAEEKRKLTEKLTAEIEKLKKQIAASDASVTAFKTRFEIWQESYRTMTDALESVGAEEKKEKCRSAVKKVLELWTNAGGVSNDKT